MREKPEKNGIPADEPNGTSTNSRRNIWRMHGQNSLNRNSVSTFCTRIIQQNQKEGSSFGKNFFPLLI
jgi:hypothetical protein